MNNCIGKCPVCGEKQLEYGEMILDGENIYFLYKCASCGTEGEEWYYLDFTGHRFYDKDGKEIDLR